MTTYRRLVPFVGFLIVAWSTAATNALADDDDEAQKAADKKFATLLADAQKDPTKADWKELRHAFAETSHYEPYDISWRTEIGKVGKNIRDGKLKEAEAGLVKLQDRVGFMRLDGHAMAVELYQKTGETVKARKHRDFLDGLTSVVMVPGHGTSYEKPIEVLFVEEEYLVMGSLGLKVKQQALNTHDGHRFDVLTTHAMADKPEQQFYFNIDMPWNALQAKLGKALEGSKKPSVKQ